MSEHRDKAERDALAAPIKRDLRAVYAEIKRKRFDFSNAVKAQRRGQGGADVTRISCELGLLALERKKLKSALAKLYWREHRTMPRVYR